MIPSKASERTRIGCRVFSSNNQGRNSIASLNGKVVDQHWKIPLESGKRLVCHWILGFSTFWSHFWSNPQRNRLTRRRSIWNHKWKSEQLWLKYARENGLNCQTYQMSWVLVRISKRGHSWWIKSPNFRWTWKWIRTICELLQLW